MDACKCRSNNIPLCWVWWVHCILGVMGSLYSLLLDILLSYFCINYDTCKPIPIFAFVKCNPLSSSISMLYLAMPPNWINSGPYVGWAIAQVHVNWTVSSKQSITHLEDYEMIKICCWQESYVAWMLINIQWPTYFTFSPLISCSLSLLGQNYEHICQSWVRI